MVRRSVQDIPDNADPVAVRRNLEAAADELNEQIALVEERLSALRLNVTAFVQFQGRISQMHGYYDGLAFARYQNSWRLVREYGPEGDPDEGTTELLSTCSKEIRAEAMPLLPELYAGLLRAADAEVAKIRAASAEAKAFLNSLPASASQGRVRA